MATGVMLCNGMYTCPVSCLPNLNVRSRASGAQITPCAAKLLPGAPLPFAHFWPFFLGGGAVTDRVIEESSVLIPMGMPLGTTPKKRRIPVQRVTRNSTVASPCHYHATLTSWLAQAHCLRGKHCPYHFARDWPLEPWSIGSGPLPPWGEPGWDKRSGIPAQLPGLNATYRMCACPPLPCRGIQFDGTRVLWEYEQV